MDSFISALSGYRSKSPRLLRQSTERVHQEIAKNFTASNNHGEIVSLDKALLQAHSCPECGNQGLKIEHYYNKTIKATFTGLAFLFVVLLVMTKIAWVILPVASVAWHVARDLPFVGRTLATCTTCCCTWRFSSNQLHPN